MGIMRQATGYPRAAVHPQHPSLDPRDYMYEDRVRPTRRGVLPSAVKDAGAIEARARIGGDRSGNVSDEEGSPDFPWSKYVYSEQGKAPTAVPTEYVATLPSEWMLLRPSRHCLLGLSSRLSGLTCTSPPRVLHERPAAYQASCATRGMRLHFPGGIRPTGPAGRRAGP